MNRMEEFCIGGGRRPESANMDGLKPCAAADASFEPTTGAEVPGGEYTAPVVGLPPGAASPCAPISQLAETKLAILHAVDRVMKDLGLSRAAACREVGVDPATELRWRRKLDAGGPEALEDNYANCGRKPLATLNHEELKIAGQHYVQTKSATTALRKLATDPRCSDETAHAILKRRRSKHTLTKTLREQLKTKVPGAVIDYHRSPTRAKREGFICPRTLTYLDARGREVSLEPGDLQERDDMSANFLFWIDWPWGGDACSERYGVRLARGQLLPQIDVRSLYFSTFCLLVRLKDSYRADDIWQWVGQSYRDIGVPAIGERWERGIWQARQLQGLPIDGGHTPWEARLGGLQALGVKMIVSQSPTTKIIENRFNFLQTIQSDIPGQIGRKRGEFEAANKLWTQCREGRRDPRDHFLSYEQVCRRIEQSFHYVNAEPVEGTLYHGIPAEIWQNGGGPERMRRLRPEETYLFSRSRALATVNKGHAMVRFTKPDGARGAWWFANDELWRHEGRRVAVYFDREAAEAGATLVHADGRNINDVIGTAELVDGCPQFALGVDFEGGRGATAMVDAIDRKKAHSNAVRAEYRALGTRNTLAKGSRASDGAGRTVVVERHTPTEGADVPEPKPAVKRGARPADFDEDDALARQIEAMEREAEARGDLLTF